MILPNPPEQYDHRSEQARNDEIQRADQLNRKARADVVVHPPERLILYSPNGTRYAVIVDDLGVLGTTPA
jgi:hypothetical protein